VKTRAPAKELAAFAGIAATALPAWGVPPGAEFRFLKLRENAVFAVNIGGEPRYVLRVHRRGYHNDAALRSELLWMTALNQGGIPTPRVIPTTQGDLFTKVPAADALGPHNCDLLSWVAGTQLGKIEDPSLGEQEFVDRTYEQVGRLAAKVHLHSESWRPDESFWRHSWDEEGVLGPRAVWGYYGDIKSLSVAQRALLERASAVARRRLAAFGKAPQRFGLIHGDLIPENILLDGEQCTLLDFDDAGFGWYVAEIAIAVFFHMGTASFEPALRAMIRGYRQVRPLPDSELHMLDVMLFLRGLAVLGWVHTRPDTATAQELRPSITASVLALAETLSGDSATPAALGAAAVIPAT
jgi:Ser/Thr protein kinase RdoA (MazF antagonist)